MIKLTTVSIDLQQHLVTPAQAVYVNRNMILWMMAAKVEKEGADPISWTDISIGNTTFSVMETPEEIIHADGV